jgi:ACS family tartrate transporter-like MFS transporter
MPLSVNCLVYIGNRLEQAKWLKADEFDWFTSKAIAERAARPRWKPAAHWRPSPALVCSALRSSISAPADFHTFGVWTPQFVKSFGMCNMRVAS